jgi:hypothetical protein
MRRTLYQPSNQKALYCQISFLFTTRGEGNHVTFMGGPCWAYSAAPNPRGTTRAPSASHSALASGLGMCIHRHMCEKLDENICSMRSK